VEFPREVHIWRPGGSETDVAAINDMETISNGTDVALYRLVRSGPLVRKVEIGQPPRKPRKDKGVSRKAVDQKE
jgi:hypothetical protein